MKNKINIFLTACIPFLIACIIVVICMKPTSEKIVDATLKEETTLFLHVQYEYDEALGYYAYGFTTIDNEGNKKFISTFISDEEEIIKEIHNPTFLLTMAENLLGKETESKYYTESKVDMKFLSKFYRETFKIKNKNDFDYGTPNTEKGVEGSFIYGFNYKNQEDFTTTTYYYSDGSIIITKDDTAKEILNYLFDVFS